MDYELSDDVLESASEFFLVGIMDKCKNVMASAKRHNDKAKYAHAMKQFKRLNKELKARQFGGK